MRVLRNVVALLAGALLMFAVLFAPVRARSRVVVGTVENVESPRILTHQDRCDIRNCGAQAFFRALFEPKSDEQRTSAVDMCVHHFRELEEKIRATAYHVLDESDRLNA